MQHYLQPDYIYADSQDLPRIFEGQTLTVEGYHAYDFETKELDFAVIRYDEEEGGEITPYNEFSITTVNGEGSFTIPSVPFGYEYTIWEETKDGWVLVSVDGDTTETIAAGIMTAENVEHTFRNEKSTTITIEKEVDGTEEDQQKDYDFTITTSSPIDKEGFTLEDETDVDGKKSYTYAFTLKHGESIETSAIPLGTEYEITEVKEEGADIETSVNGEETDTVSGVLEEAEEFKYVNKVIHKYKVTYKYDKDYPQDVLDTLPTDDEKYEDETVITPKNPDPESINKDYKTYTFEGWDAETKTIQGADIEFVGTWKVVDNLTYKELYEYDGTYPQDVLDTLPTSDKVYYDGDTVTAKKPKPTTVPVDEGEWVFKGWQKDSEVVNGKDVLFIGTWEFVKDEPTPTPSPTPIPTPTPTPTPSPTPEPTVEPTPTPEAPIRVVPRPKPPGRTCQDDGYPAGYYWNGQACVVGHPVPYTKDDFDVLNYIALLGLMLVVSVGSITLLKKQNR